MLGVALNPTLLVIGQRVCEKLRVAKTKTKAAAANIYAVVGSDESEVKRMAADLAAKVTPPDAGDFGLAVIDGVVDNAEQAASPIRSTIEGQQTVPFLGGILVWLKYA